MSALVHQLRPHIPAVLKASGVGTWEYDVLEAHCFLDAQMAAMLGFTAEEVKGGVPLDRVRSRMNRTDRERGIEAMRPLSRNGGVFVFEFRAYPKPGVERWLLGRGRFESDGGGAIIYARGITVDVTDGEAAGLLADPSGFVSTGCAAGLTASERAADAVMAAHKAIMEMGAEARPSLLPMAELMLHEIGRQIGTGLKQG